MTYKWNIFGAGILIWGIPSLTLAMPLEQLFDSFWSYDCVESVQIETPEYTSFSPTEWCHNSVDTFKTQQTCQNASFEALPTNRIKVKLEQGEEFIIECMSSGKVGFLSP